MTPMRAKNSPHPVAVLISDTHYTVATLEIADKAYRAAIKAAHTLDVPLIDLGDLTNDKAILRAEVVNKLIETFGYATELGVHIICLVGNHSLLNEKGTAHALKFLPHAAIVDTFTHHPGLDLYLLPYYTDAKALAADLAKIPKGSTVLLHQGVMGADMGHYVQDKTSLPAEAFANFRAISGHYHKRQDIQCGPQQEGKIGTYSYVGNPYSLSFGEANDGPKGFNVLMSDGSLDFHPLDLPRHVIYEMGTALQDMNLIVGEEDKLWIKVHGHPSQLAAFKKADLAEYIGRTNFKLDLIPTETDKAEDSTPTALLTDAELLDKLISESGEGAEQQAYLKSLWRSVYEAT